MQELARSSHANVSFTAKMVALARMPSDIPYATSVAEYMGAGEIAGTLGSLDNFQWMAPLIEARYKSIASALRRTGYEQVIEFAGGLSFRGLWMTQANPRLHYWDTDLPDLTAEKKRFLKSRGIALPETYTVAEANILSWRDIEAILARCDPKKPIAVVHEGLLMYLTPAEKRAAATHIRRILEKHGGAWITPDFSSILEGTWTIADGSGAAERMGQIVAKTTESFFGAPQAKERAATEFCSELGFQVQDAPQVDGSYTLTTLDRLTHAKTQFAPIQNQLRIWTMTLP